MRINHFIRWKYYLAGFIIVFVFIVSNVHSYLGVTIPVKADVLVVEGWIFEKPSIKNAVVEFNKGNYKRLVTIGGHSGNPEKTTAELAAVELIKSGMNQKKMIVINMPYTRNERTYSTANTFRNWYLQHNRDINGINVFTIGVHGRKSWIIFSNALKSYGPVGVIAGEESEYDPRFWWCSEKGIKIVSRNMLGYLYALYLIALPESSLQKSKYVYEESKLFNSGESNILH